MSSLALLLVLAAAIAHATWNLTTKRTAHAGVPFLWLGALASVLLWLPLAAVRLAGGVDWPALGAGAGVSAVLHAGYMLLLQRGYRAADISVVYPLARGTGPLFSVVLAIVLLGEDASPAGLAGTALVVAGVVAIGWPRGRSTRLGRDGGDRPVALRDGPNRLRAGVLYGLIIGVAIATYTLWDAYVVTVLGVDPVAFMVGCAAGEALLLLPVALRARSRVAEVWRTSRGSVVLVGVLSPLSYILVLVAFTIAPVSLVAPARELSVVLVALAGWLLLREQHPVQRVAGSVVVLVGVALLAGA